VTPAASTASATTTDTRAEAAERREPRSGCCSPVRTSVMDGHHLDIFMIAAPVELLVFDPKIGKMHLLVEVREVVFVGPLFDLSRIAIGVAVVVLTLPVARVQPLLVLTLELVVEDHPLDARVAFLETLCDAQVGLVDLRVVFELAFAFEAGIELLPRVVVAASMGLQQVPAAISQYDSHVASAVQPDGVDEPLLTQVPEVSIARIGWSAEMVSEVLRRNDSECADGRERTGLGPA
jgi:hypothetical protein